MKSLRQRSLLAWLVLHSGEPQARARVASLLWPEVDEVKARNDLRKLLHDLRTAWSGVEEFVQIERDWLTWKHDSDYRLDVDQLVAASKEDIGPDGTPRVAALYAGDLLPDCYDDWILPPRDHLRRLFLDVLQRGAEAAQANGQYRIALSHAQRLLQEEPLREDFHLTVIRLHELAGDRAGALASYHACSTLLAAELGVQPGQPIADLFRDIVGSPADRTELTPEALPDLVGRDREYINLQEAWRRADGGMTVLAAIRGDQGIGKTRLAREIRSWAARQGTTVYEASCYEGAQLAPYGAVLTLLGRETGPTGRLAGLSSVWRHELSRLLPDLSEDRASAATPIREQWEQARLLEAICRALSLSQPALVLIDDLQYCDTESLNVFHRLSHFDPAARLMLLVTVRDDIAEVLEHSTEQTPSVRRLLEEAQPTIDLVPLTKKETARLGAAFSPHLATPLRDRAVMEQLYRDTEGNPLYVTEMVRAGWEPGLRPPLPGTLEAAILARLSRLPPHVRALLDSAAAIGASFPLAVLRHASQSPEATFVQDLDELWRRRVLRERHTEVSAGYEFSHAQIRNVAYSALSRARREMLHRQAAEAYEAVGRDGGQADAASIARHLDLAGAHAEAAGWYLQAGQTAGAAYANEEAISLYRRARQISDGKDAIEAGLCLAGVLQITGAWDEADRLLRDGLAQAERLREDVLAARCRAGIGDLLRLRGRYEACIVWLQDAAEQLSALRQEGERCRVLGLMTEALLWLAQYDEAEKVARQHCDGARASGDESQLASALSNLGTVSVRRTRFAEALERYEQAMEIEQRLDDAGRLIRITSLIANVHRLRGDLTLARESFKRQVALARQIGYLHGEMIAGGNLGIVIQEQGEFEAAAVWLERSLTIARRLGDERAQASTLHNLGVVNYDRGRYLEARQAIVSAIDLFERTGDRRNSSVAMATLGTIYSDLGAYDHAFASARASLLASCEIGNPQQAMMASGVIGQMLLDQGRTKVAQGFVQRALKLATTREMVYWESLYLHLLAQLELNKRDVSSAVRHNDRALNLASQTQHKNVRRRALIFQAGLAIAADSSVSAVRATLTRLVVEAQSDADRADASYAIWKLDGSKHEHDEAANAYRAAYRRFPKVEYASRLEELTGLRPKPPPSLPPPPGIVSSWTGEMDDLLDALDRL